MDNQTVLKDAFGLLCAEQIGCGMSRRVYACGLDNGLIVKVEEGAKDFQNIIEWETWTRVRLTRWERWFAPVVHISSCGSVLVMARTVEPRKREFPKKLPIFLTDTKRNNYGIYKSRFVCHDYGSNLLMEYGMCDKMRNVAWWNE